MQFGINDGIWMRSMEIVPGSVGSTCRSGSETATDAQEENTGSKLAEKIYADSGWR